MARPGVGNTQIIREFQSTRDLLLKPAEQHKTGLEIELFVLKKQGSDWVPIGAEDNKNLFARLEKPADYGYRFAPVLLEQESTMSMIEYNSSAQSFDKLSIIIDEFDQTIGAIKEVCHDLGFKISDCAQLQNDMSDIEVNRYPRAQALAQARILNGYPDFYKHSQGNAALQVSASFRDDAHFVELIRLGACLTPIVGDFTDNSAGRFDGKADVHNTGLRLRQSIGKTGLGGMPDVFSDQTAQGIVARYVDWALTRKMLIQFDRAAQELLVPSPDKRKSFAELVRENDGFNHVSNRDLALSTVWPHIKLGVVKDGRGDVLCSRIEFRAGDSNIAQAMPLLLIYSALANNRECVERTSRLLAEFGFDIKNPAPDTRGLLRRSIKSAVAYGQDFGHGKRRHFLSRFGAIMHDVYKDSPRHIATLQPFLRICATGESLGISRRLAAAGAAYATAVPCP